MRALLRYALLKVRREKMALAVLFSPLMLVGAPLLGLMVRAMLRSERFYPIALGYSTQASMAATFCEIGAVFSTLAAGAAAFALFRSEIASRTMGFFLLAARPGTIAGAAIVFGAAAGVVAFVAALGAVFVLTGHTGIVLPKTLLVVGLGSPFAASMAIAFCALSTDYGILVAFLILQSAATVTLIAIGGVPVIAAMVAGGATLHFVAARMLERRCAG